MKILLPIDTSKVKEKNKLEPEVKVESMVATTREIPDSKEANEGDDSELQDIFKGSKIDIPSDEESVIMIIEDDTHFAKILSDIAESRGHSVICVDSGEKGLAVVNEINVDAIILDLGLPGMNGWEVLKRLKKEAKLKNIPIHIMSDRNFEKIKEKKGF